MFHKSIAQLHASLSPSALLQLVFLETAIATTLGTFIFTTLSFVSPVHAVDSATIQEQLTGADQSTKQVPIDGASATDLGELIEAQLIIPVSFDCLGSIIPPEFRDLCSAMGGNISPIPDGGMEVLLESPSKEPIDRFEDLDIPLVESPEHLILFEQRF